MNSLLPVPGPISQPSVASISSTNVVLTWDPPQDPNGVIQSYTVEVNPLRFDQDPFSSSRKRKQIEEGVEACYQHLNLTHSQSIVVFGRRLNVTLGKTWIFLTHQHNYNHLYSIIQFHLYTIRPEFQP